MWPPPNIQSLPSKDETQAIKEEILTIELEIIETELRLDALRKSLSERKAWIAPIRKIPHEILSLVFIEASRTDWKAPLVLQSVSRRWRDGVVDSPEAWTFIPLSRCSSKRRSELISLFLERSCNRPLHVSVKDDSLLGYMEILADRIKCIHLRMGIFLRNCYLQHGHTFHRLERLEIWDRHSAEDAPAADSPAAWDMLSFPNLKVLGIKSRSPSLLRAISAVPEFPAIRHLKVNRNRTSGLHDILTKCAPSLESFDLIYINEQSEGLDTEHKIHFPRLRYLRLVDHSNGAESCLRFKAATPNLQVHIDDGKISTMNVFKVDTGSVIFLHVSRTPDLSQYPRLVTICFSGRFGKEEEIIKVIECLRDNPALCPDLALIECAKELTQEQLTKAKDALITRGDVTGHIIPLTRAIPKVWEERIKASRGIEKCGDHMPCNLLT